jgi:hypothetical protein
VVEVTEAQAKRLVLNGRGWSYADKQAENAPPVLEAPVEGDDTEETVSEPQEPSQGQEEPVVEESANESNVPVEDSKEQDPAPTLEEIREWARANRPDLNVKEKGRVSRAATEAYREAFPEKYNL